MLAGVIVASYQARQSSRQQERERAAKERETTSQLVGRSSKLAGSFYFALQEHWRQKTTPAVWGEADGPKLDETYRAWASEAEVLEAELEVRYAAGSRAPADVWHQIRDLLTVRYFDLRDRASANLLQLNAKNEDRLHSGLSVQELRDQGTVLRTYRKAMDELGESLAKSHLTA
mgnify:CR=1 FL=1